MNEKRDKLVKEWIKEISDYIAEQESQSLDVEEKSSRNDLVTNMDKSIEEKLVNRIREHYPGDRIVGEEGFGDEVENLNGTVWFLDPIDGTLNFVLQQDNFAVMIGIYEEGIGQAGYIYDVKKDRLYSATKGEGVSCDGQQLDPPPELSLSEGMLASSSALMVKDKHPRVRDIGKESMGVRMIGSAGLESVEVAKGNVVGYLASNLKPWDIAPGLIFMEELGLKATQFNNEPIDMLKNNNDVILSTKKAHKSINKLLNN